ncbi:MAG: HlyC/CorC family transporter [Myxococcales bacterium]|nr:HlyC/CorC family transporter [Myxococcales bacterium]
MALMLLNGVFAGAEIAVLTVRKTRLAELIDEKRAGASAVRWLRKQPERFLATVQIGITVVGTAAAAIGGERLAHAIGQKLAGVPFVGHWLSKAGLLIVVVGITVLEVVVGELVPKSLALRSAERYALAMGPVLRVMASVVKPAVWALTGLSNLVLKLFGDKTSFTETRLSPEELQELVEEAARTGSLDAKSSEIASRAIEFRALTAFDVMVPRNRIVSVPRQCTEDELRAALEGRRYARLPVYDGSPENIIGYLAVKDLFARRTSALGPNGADEACADTVSGVLRAVQFVPETLAAVTLLRRMQRERAPLVIVVDEGGAVVGLVTIEDLVEEIVGDISSEQDAPVRPLVLDAERAVELPGEMPIREVSRQLGLELLEPEEYTTVAGLCIYLAREIPAIGATFTLADGSVLTVLDATPRKVRLVRLTVAPEKVSDES